MKKEIIFFDGDGTLWYPKKTKHKEGAWWVYQLPGGHKEHNKHLTLTPTTISTLKKLKKKGVITVILSTHPRPPKEAQEVLDRKVKLFNLKSLFDEVHATRTKHEAKGELIIKILKKRKIPKRKALMVGDNYFLDYKSARDKGIDAVLIETEYPAEKHHVVRRIKNKIEKLSDLLGLV